MNKSHHIPFHRPTLIGGEEQAIQQAITAGIWSKESEESHHFFKTYYPQSQCFFVNSCSAALEMAVRVLGIGHGDEIIIPGFTYLAVANAVVNNGAKPVYADVLPNGNIDVQSVINCISPNTKAVIGIHYAGNPFDVKALLQVCESNKIYLIEDAAQCIGSLYDGKPLGAFGHLACLSFDYMKNVSCGQGGLLIVNDGLLLSKVQIVFDNGANKYAMLNGSQAYFDWAGKGNNSQINPLATYFLSVQLKALEEITESRLKKWNLYTQLLIPLERTGKFTLPKSKEGHNGHIFYVIAECEKERDKLRKWLRENGIFCEHHYSSLAESSYGKQFILPGAALQNSEKLCHSLLRLPLWHDITEEAIEIVATSMESFCIEQIP